jgi:hypothetical protein
MAQDFINQMANGGGRIEWIFFIHGLPWSVCSHPDVLTALPVGSADADVRVYRRSMFGDDTVTVDATPTTPAYNIPIFDILDADIGAQTVKFEEGKQLTGGSWSVNIASESLGYSWSHRDGTIWGLEGLDAIPSDLADSSIAVARLSRDLEYDGSTLYFDRDTGNKLNEKITANFATDTPSGPCR